MMDEWQGNEEEHIRLGKQPLDMVDDGSGDEAGVLRDDGRDKLNVLENILEDRASCLQSMQLHSLP